MSEQDWQKFLSAEGVEDWVVLHGGAAAVFRVRSLGEAAQLAEAMARLPGLEESGALLTISHDRLSVRLSRGVFRLEEPHIERARAVSATARSHGAVADRTCVHEVQVAVAAQPVLGYAPLDEDNAVDPLGHGSTVWMQELDADKPLRHAMRPHRRGRRGPGGLDSRRPRRQPRVRRRLARRFRPGCSGW